MTIAVLDCYAQIRMPLLGSNLLTKVSVAERRQNG